MYNTYIQITYVNHECYICIIHVNDDTNHKLYSKQLDKTNLTKIATIHVLINTNQHWPLWSRL